LWPQVRNAGPADPPAKPLIQNQYATAWTRMNAARAASFDRNSTYIPPRATVATKGHLLGAEVARARAEGARYNELQSAGTAGAMSSKHPLCQRAFRHSVCRWKSRVSRRASLSIRIVLAGHLPQSAAATFKLSKFKHAQPKVFDHLKGSSAPLGSYKAAEEAAHPAAGPETAAQAAVDVPAPVAQVAPPEAC
jgi:hypothetical protein